jgi:YesN/AraC family two-component response regulator
MKDKAKILYVDDEEINLRLFKVSFRRDYDIYTALSGFEALNLIEQVSFKIVITDQSMPGMTGVELLKKIFEIYPEMPPDRLIISGYMEDNEIREAFEKYKLSKFIAKPWKYNELKMTIDNILLQL